RLLPQLFQQHAELTRHGTHSIGRKWKRVEPANNTKNDRGNSGPHGLPNRLFGNSGGRARRVSRQHDPHGQAAAGPRRRGDRAVVRLRDRPDDREPRPIARPVGPRSASSSRSLVTTAPVARNNSSSTANSLRESWM